MTVYIRAEVGLLRRNVVFNGVNEQNWNAFRLANACPDEFGKSFIIKVIVFYKRQL